MADRPPRRRGPALARLGATFAVGLLLGVAVWFQRETIGAALAELRSMTVIVVAVLVGLAAVERLSRADILRRLIDGATFGQAFTIHDVGTAASKGVPFGGPLSLALRWSIAQDARIPTSRLASALVAYGVATTFVTWLLPFGWLIVDLTQRPATTVDVVGLAACVAVLGGSVAFWAVLLSSERAAAWTTRWVRRGWQPIARRSRSAQRHDPSSALIEVRDALRVVARRPFGLLARTLVAQLCSAVILLVALRGVGVGAELGTVEFARVYFVVTLLSSFAPVPGGIGVVEAGLTGALVAAGVDAVPALAGVLVYRLLTYVAPIVVGALLYAIWRLRRADVGVDATERAVVLAAKRG